MTSGIDQQGRQRFQQLSATICIVQSQPAAQPVMSKETNAHQLQLHTTSNQQPSFL
jgi:hypothetical protein